MATCGLLVNSSGALAIGIGADTEAGGIIGDGLGIGFAGDSCCAIYYIQAKYCATENGHNAGDLANFWFRLYRVPGVLPDTWVTVIHDENGDDAGIPHYFNVIETNDRIFVAHGNPTTCNPGEQDEGTLETIDSCCNVCPDCPDESPVAYDFAFSGVGFQYILDIYKMSPQSAGDFEVCACQIGLCEWDGSTADVPWEIVAADSGELVPCTAIPVGSACVGAIGISGRIYVSLIRFPGKFILRANLQFDCVDAPFGHAFIELFYGELVTETCNETMVITNAAEHGDPCADGTPKISLNGGSCTITPRTEACPSFSPKYQLVISGTTAQCAASVSTHPLGASDIDGTWNDLVPGDNIVDLIDTVTFYDDYPGCSMLSATQFNWAPPAHSKIILTGLGGSYPATMSVEVQHIDADGNIVFAWNSEESGPCGNCCGWPLTLALPFKPFVDVGAGGEIHPYKDGGATLFLTNCGENAA